MSWYLQSIFKLEQVECLLSGDTPRHLMITHIIESYWIPSQKKTKSKLQIKRIAKISYFLIVKQTLHLTHLLKLLNTMCKYEMDPTSIVEDTEGTRFCPQTDRGTDGQTNRRTRWNQNTFNRIFSTSLKRGYNYSHSAPVCVDFMFKIEVQRNELAFVLKQLSFIL